MVKPAIKYGVVGAGSHGQQRVHDSIEAQARGAADRRWAAFAGLISSRRLPSNLQ